MKVYLVRHGECDSNVLGIYNYRSEDLNEHGIKQAEFLKEQIKDMEFDAIYSSPLIRAIHTSNIINSEKKDIIIDERLRERESGLLEGMSIQVTNREEYWNYYTKTNYGNEERIPDLFNRVKDFLDELKTKDYDKVLIVAHSGVSKAFYVYFNGIPKDGNLLNLGLKNTEIKEYELF